MEQDALFLATLTVVALVAIVAVTGLVLHSQPATGQSQLQLQEYVATEENVAGDAIRGRRGNVDSESGTTETKTSDSTYASRSQK